MLAWTVLCKPLMPCRASANSPCAWLTSCWLLPWVACASDCWASSRDCAACCRAAMLADAFSLASAMPARISSTPAIGPLLLGIWVSYGDGSIETDPATQRDHLTLPSDRGPGISKAPDVGTSGAGPITVCAGVVPAPVPHTEVAGQRSPRSERFSCHFRPFSTGAGE